MNKRKPKNMRSFRSPDGTEWGVEVNVPGASNAMVVFHHPGGKTARLDRYAWHIWRGAEAGDVRSRLSARRVLDGLSEADIARLFRMSMPISAGASPLEPANVAA